MIIVSVLASLLVASGVLAAEQEKVKLHYLTWAGGTAAQNIQEDFIEPFEAQNPHIEIEYEAVSFRQFFDKLIMYYAAGESPDLMHMSVAYVYEFAQQGILENLSPYFDRDLNPNDYFVQPMDAMRYPSVETGDLYGIPFAYVMSSLFYNQDMFDSKGLVYPGEDFKWEDISSVGRKLNTDTDGDSQPDKWGFWSAPRYEILDTIIHAYGGRTLNDDYTKVLLDEPEAIKAAEVLAGFIKEGAAPPLTLHGSGTSLFRSGNLGLFVGNMSNMDGFRASGFNWNVAPMPSGPAGRVVRVWPDSFAMSSNSKHKEEAWEYIKFVISSTEMDRYSGARKLPVNKQLAMSEAWMERDQLPNKQVFIDSVPYGRPLEFRPKWGEWEPIRSKLLRDAFNGVTSIRYAMEESARQIRLILGIK